MKTSEIKPALKLPPGYFIREQMELRHWTQEDMASVLGVTIKHVNKILTNKQPITLDMARVLGKVFNNTPQFWMNLEIGYRLWLQQEKTQKEIDAKEKAQIFERMPINDMIKKGWLTDYNTLSDLKESVLTFFNINTFDFSQLDAQAHILTKKSDAYNQFNAPYLLTWYQMAKNVAKSKKVAEYNDEKLKSLYDRLHLYTVVDYGINNFIIELSNCGVIFFVLPHLQKTYLDGAAFLLGDTPVIVYTGRYKRIDNFWFTVAHEIAHVLKHLNNDDPHIFDDFKEATKNKKEDEANEMAAEKLKHNEILKYLNQYLGYLTTSKVEECSELLKIHPSIIIGKLAHDNIVSYRNQTLYNKNVLEIINREYLI